ncbi:cell wall glucanosyltransferase Mwg1 [Beauveria bassiana ARSEF 2860]|uniref:Cell wall glucanosyltransferase Mwg1 n=1 Tax=Beauveria bassiana (strain ARSEF 2860) TaxID=655819 RepID=J4VRW5_BEAB2|nr:cell wall glucanosyltransferase Mwg1 [Beauveria bassiana ARSEF 2860]EJP61350.1 cell wall glucanosyltransferase Mwg1 [Beauveria bassiana ARSEF 2860]
MLSKALVSAAALALAVSAQTSTTCSPLKQDCPADPAVGKKSIRCDFTKGACDAFEHIAGKEVTYGPRGAVSAVDAPMQAPTLQSKKTIFFGRLEVEMKAAPGKGVITSIVLLSDDLDEIDIEAVGSDTARIQSNTFSRGDSTRHDLLGYLPVADTTAAAGHTYTVDWTTERIEFAVDGVSPMRVKLGAWVAGYEGNAPGTIEWAGGVADFSRGAAEAVFERVTVTDYAGGSAATERDVEEYSYGDRSGSSKSIRIHLADGTTITGEAPSSGGSGSSGSSVSGSSVSGNSVSGSSFSGSSVSGSTSIETAESSSPVSSAAAAAFTKEVLAMGRAATENNSTMITKTTASTQTRGDGSGTATHTATRSSVPSAPPVTAAAAAGLTVGAGLVALAILFAL